MARKIAFFMLLILLSGVALATDFTGYKYSGDKFTLNGDNFTLRLSNDEEMLSFKSNLEFVTVNKGSCESTLYYKYCFNNTVIDFDKDLGKLHDYTGELMPALQIMVISLKPDLKVTMTPTTKTPNEFQEIQIAVMIENKGKKAASIRYLENITAPAKPSSCKLCSIIDNQVLYIATMYPGDIKEFSYYLNPKDMEKVILSPKLAYTTDIGNGTASVTALNILPKKSFTITYSGATKITVEKNERSTLTFKNNDPDNRISFISTLQNDDVAFASTDSDVKTEKNKLTFTGTLEPGESEEFNIWVLGKISGKKKIIIANNYKMGSDNVNSNSTFDLEVIIEKPVFDFPINTTQFSDIAEIAELNIDNTESSNSFKDMEVKIDVPGVIDESFIIPFLKFARELKAYRKDYILESEAKKTIEAKATISYKTIYDESISQTITKKITLNPLKDIISIEHNIEDYKQESGSLLISTFIKNNDDRTIVLNISEIIEGADVLTLDARTVADYTKLTAADYLYVTQLSKKQAFSYMLKKKALNTATMKSMATIEGASSIYLITFNSVIDFEKKTITLKNSTLEKISEIQREEEEESGVLTENIELEETHSYDSSAKEIISEPEKEPDNTFDVSTKVNGESTPNQAVNNTEKKGFFTKIIDIIKSFF